MAGAHASGQFQVNVVTPFGPIANEETDAVIAPGELGEFEVLPGHVPFLSELHTGVLTLGERAERKVYAVGRGYLEVEPGGRVQVLVERAVGKSEIDVDEAQAELAEVGPKLSAWKGELDGEYVNLKSTFEWAQARIDACKSS